MNATATLPQPNSNCKPSITRVIGKYVELRPNGKELTGLCPFHAEQTPSFRVNEAKGLFHCFGCGAGGDVIRFIELVEKIPFKQACARLRLNTHNTLGPRPYRAEAETIVRWAWATSRRLTDALHEISQEIYVCSVARKQPTTDKQFLAEYEAELIRRWAILCDLDDDLNNPKLLLDLWAERKAIESLVDKL